MLKDQMSAKQESLTICSDTTYTSSNEDEAVVCPPAPKLRPINKPDGSSVFKMQKSRIQIP